MTTSLGNRPERPAVLKEPVAHPVPTVMISLTMAAKKTEKLSKSAFIRQHPNLSTADVIAKGKEAGLKFTSSLVYMVRGPKEGTPKKTAAKKTSAKKAAGSKKVSAPKSAATSKNAAPKETGESKAAFVRTHAALNPKEIVEKAKAQGMRLAVTYVYAVRAQQAKDFRKEARAKAEAESTRDPKGAPAPRNKASNGTSPSGAASAVEDLLRAAAAELGLARAIEILSGERARIQAMLGASR